jgi:signal peptidase
MSPLRRARQILVTAAFVAVVVAWAVFLRPQYVGGSAGYVTVSGTSMEPELHTGDIVLVRRRESYRVGDVVAYRVPAGEPAAGRVVIHRIIGGSASAGYVMRGDNRDSNDIWRPHPADVVGKQQVTVPGAGRAAGALLSPFGLGLLAGSATIVLLLPGKERQERPDRRRRRRRRVPTPRREYGPLLL